MAYRQPASVNGSVPASSVAFTWDRNRLYDRHACLVLYDMLLENPTVEINSVAARQTKKWRPKPLSTVIMQQRASIYLRINSHQAMQHAEALYMKGLISYPRTETDNFKAGTDLPALIEIQTHNPQWNGRIAQHAQKLLNNESGLYRWPSPGKLLWKWCRDRSELLTNQQYYC